MYSHKGPTNAQKVGTKWDAPNIFAAGLDVDCADYCAERTDATFAELVFPASTQGSIKAKKWRIPSLA